MDESGAGNAPIILLSTPGTETFVELIPVVPPPPCHLDIRSTAVMHASNVTSLDVPLPDGVAVGDVIILQYGIFSSVSHTDASISDNFGNFYGNAAFAPGAQSGGTGGVASKGAAVATTGDSFTVHFDFIDGIVDDVWVVIAVIKDRATVSTVYVDDLGTPPTGTAASFPIAVNLGDLVIAMSVGTVGKPVPVDAFTEVATTNLINGGAATIAKFISIGPGFDVSRWDIPFFNGTSSTPQYFSVVSVWAFTSACGE